jgi:transcription antitermination factor NusG
MLPTTDIVPMRFPERSLDQAEERWWIAKVKPRQEKKLAEDFLRERIEYYLPLYPKNTPRPGTNYPRIFHVPLFPGYLAFAQKQPHNIFLSGRVVKIIEIRHQQRFIREMNQVYFALQGNAPLGPVTGRVELGSYVKILHGPFAGIYGKVSRGPGSTKLILTVEGLGNAELTIERAWTEEIPGKVYH